MLGVLLPSDVAVGSGLSGVAYKTGLAPRVVAGESGWAAVALEVRAGQGGHMRTSRGGPVRLQGNGGARKSGKVMLRSD